MSGERKIGVCGSQFLRRPVMAFNVACVVGGLLLTVFGALVPALSLGPVGVAVIAGALIGVGVVLLAQECLERIMFAREVHTTAYARGHFGERSEDRARRRQLRKKRRKRLKELLGALVGISVVVTAIVLLLLFYPRMFGPDVVGLAIADVVLLPTLGHFANLTWKILSKQ